MIKNNMNNKKYKEALDQIQNTLQHQETIDLIIEILSKRSDFVAMVLKALSKQVKFWLTLIGVSLFISVAVVKFPDLAAWIISLLSGK